VRSDAPAGFSRSKNVILFPRPLAELLRAVTEQGYNEPTPVQTRAIPVVLSADLQAAAQTGTGKTAGFTLPLLQRLQTSPGPAADTAIRCVR